jgi:excisionase family DNA binding protein
MRIDWQKLPKYLSIQQVCKILGVHPNTLRNWDKNGYLKAVRFGPRQDRRYEKEKVFAIYKIELDRTYKETFPEKIEVKKSLFKIRIPGFKIPKIQFKQKIFPVLIRGFVFGIILLGSYWFNYFFNFYPGLFSPIFLER